LDRQKKAYIFALLSVLCWSTVATAFKISLRSLSPTELLLYSSFTASFALLLIIVVSGKLRHIKDLSPGDFARFAYLGFLNPFLYYLILFRAYDILPAQEALTLNYTWAVIVVILSIPLLKQKIHAWGIIFVLLSFVGVIVIATHGNLTGLKFANPLGTGLALGSSLVWATYWIFGTRDKRDPVIRLFLTFFSGFLFTLVFGLVINQISFHINSEGLVGSGYIGLFEMGITFVFWQYAMSLTKTTDKVGSLVYLSPFLSLILINFILKEPLELSTVIGFILIMAGIFGQKIIR
jgi:drug/metabolite transporter (DMT)-like permease